jgi:hypothetical protein
MFGLKTTIYGASNVYASIFTAIKILLFFRFFTDLVNNCAKLRLCVHSFPIAQRSTRVSLAFFPLENPMAGMNSCQNSLKVV